MQTMCSQNARILIHQDSSLLCFSTFSIFRNFLFIFYCHWAMRGMMCISLQPIVLLYNVDPFDPCTFIARNFIRFCDSFSRLGTSLVAHPKGDYYLLNTAVWRGTKSTFQIRSVSQFTQSQNKKLLSKAIAIPQRERETQKERMPAVACNPMHTILRSNCLVL